MATPLLKRSVFNVFAEQNNESRIHVEVKGLGIVSINRTDEGVIVDIFDNLDGNDSLASLALENQDFSEAYANELQREIEKFDPSVDLDAMECVEAYKSGVSTSGFIENYFKPEQQVFDLSSLEPLKGECKRFTEQIKDLTRPYIKITPEQQNDLLNGEADFYRTQGGKVVTFGASDEGYALMTLNDEAAKEILAKQSYMKEMLHYKEVSPHHAKIFNEAGWWLNQSTSECADFEYDLTFLSSDCESLRHSFNLRLTLNWQSSSVCLTVGANKGEGVELLHDITLAEGQYLAEALDEYLETLISQSEVGPDSAELISLINLHADKWNEVLSDVRELSDKLGVA